MEILFISLFHLMKENISSTILEVTMLHLVQMNHMLEQHMSILVLYSKELEYKFTLVSQMKMVKITMV